MENIHILTTLKPSRILRGLDGIRIFKNEVSPDSEWCVNVNIHITNDDEIKDGDKRINNYQRKPEGEEIPSKKIILTTDDQLIQDGVQPIDDEFLEWFVKNPSCEDVKVVKEGYKKNDMIDEATSYIYKIIIPKEEQKQHLIGMMKADEELGLYDETEHLLSTQANKERLLEDVKEETQRMYSEEEVIDLLQEMNDYPTIFEGRIDIKEWFEQLKKK
jgi:hypothetical protein